MRATPIPRELLTHENLSVCVSSITYRTPILDYREGACVLRDAILDRRPWFRVIPNPPAPTKRVLCYMVADITTHLPPRYYLSENLRDAIADWCIDPTPVNTDRLRPIAYWSNTGHGMLLQMAIQPMRAGIYFGDPVFDRANKFLIDACGMCCIDAKHYVEVYQLMTALHKWVPPYTPLDKTNKSG